MVSARTPPMLPKLSEWQSVAIVTIYAILTVIVRGSITLKNFHVEITWNWVAVSDGVMPMQILPSRLSLTD